VAVEVEVHEAVTSVFWLRLEDGSRKLATLNLVPGRAVYGESLLSFKGLEYRLWDPFRSKLAAAILKGISTVPLKSGSKVLYLGAASGTTASHVSDIVVKEGCVYCVDFAPRSFRELMGNLSKYRSNIVPILGDARFPAHYSGVVSVVDLIYCDVAQPEQAKLLADNADYFLKENGSIILMIKSRSIDAVKAPSEVFEREVKILKSRRFKITDLIRLEPYDKDHMTVLGRRL
jgi:fibrillarin-like pre-rRNA processing protein